MIQNCFLWVLTKQNSFFFQAEDGIRDFHVTGVQTCALPITTAVTRDLANVQKVGNDAKTGIASLKQEVAANKAVADAAAAKIDGMATSTSQQTQSVQNLKEQMDKLRIEMTALDNLTTRMRNSEEAISA